MRRTRVVFPTTMLLLLALPGCGYRFSRPDPAPIDAFGTPPAGMGQICVLRPRLAPSALVFIVRDNGKLVGATLGSSFFCYLAEPGPHRITSERNKVEETTTVLIEANRRYYLYQNVDPYPDATRSWLSWVSEAEARSMRGECTYRVLTGLPGNELPPGDKPSARADRSLSAAPVIPVSENAAATTIPPAPEKLPERPAPEEEREGNGVKLMDEGVIDAKTGGYSVTPTKKSKRRRGQVPVPMIQQPRE